MEILIVDDESSTRDALREVLTTLGHKPIIEAKNGEEALKMVDAEKTRIRLIIADWEMPYMDGITFSDKLAERETMDQVPFLLITSDLPASRIAEVKDHHKRIDHSLFKPFRVRMLDEAIKQAYANRVSKRESLLWVGSTRPAGPLLEALSERKERIFFRNVVVDSQNKAFSAVLLDLENFSADASAIQALKKSPLGSSALWVGLSRDPDKVASFRTICHQFLDSSTFSSPSAWGELLEALHRRITNGWEIELLSLEAKGLIQQKKAAAAREILQKLLKLDPVNAESHAWLADLLIQEGDTANAVLHESEALKINPCLPKPYIKILELLARSDPGKTAEIARSAERFCPQSADVLGAAAAALEAAGHPEDARKITEKILKLGEKKK